MKLRQKAFLYAFLPLVGLGLGWTGIASAHGQLRNISPDEIAARQKTMFEEQAQLLGITVEEIKNKWAEGKTLFEIAKEKGISEEQLKTRMQNLRKEELRTQIQTLVGKGVITQTQADQRLKFMEQWLENGRRGRGFHRMGFMGFRF